MSWWDKIKDGISKEYDEAVDEFEFSDLTDGLGDLWANYSDRNDERSGGNSSPPVTSTGTPLSQPVPSQGVGSFANFNVNWQVVGVGIAAVSLLVTLIARGR